MARRRSSNHGNGDAGERVQRLSWLLMVLHGICLLLSLLVCAAGGYVRLAVEPCTELVENYDGNAIFAVIIAVGVCSVVANICGLYMSAVSLGLQPSAGGRRRHIDCSFVVYLTLSVTACVALLAGAIVCFAHISHLHSSFSSGLRRALTLYSTNVNVKRTVDRLQMNFGCCGNEDYTDWFRVAWIQDVYMHPSNYGDSGMVEGGRLVDSVPFSCCSPHSVRPCVHQWVRDGGRHANYAWQQDLTLYRLGCRQALMDFFGSRVLVTTGAIILAVFFVQVVMTILTRYLQVTCMAVGITLQSDVTRRSSGSKRQSVSNEGRGAKNGHEDSKSRKSISERRYSQPRESIRAQPVAQASDEVVKVLDDDDYSWGSDFDEVDENEEERTQLMRHDTRRNNNQHALPPARKYKRKSHRRQ